jgi:hypothetical protein
MDTGEQARRVGLELDTDPDTIHGTLEHQDGTRERFWGWLELMAALERATGPTHKPPEAETDDRRGRR